MILRTIIEVALYAWFAAGASVYLIVHIIQLVT